MASAPALIHSAAVYCGSRFPADPVYDSAAAAFGRWLAVHGVTLIFGGTAQGTMKTLADAALAAGGKVIGVFPANLPDSELHPGLTAVFRTPDLAERKKRMIALAEVLIALPGGFGTFDELFDALGARKIPGGHRKPVGVLNVNGFFDPVLALIARSVQAGYTVPGAELLCCEATPEALFARLSAGLTESPDAADLASQA